MRIELTANEDMRLREMAKALPWGGPAEDAHFLASILLHIIDAANGEADYQAEQRDQR